MIKTAEIILTFASGRRHSVCVKLDEGESLASAIDAATLALELYVEDHPDGPKPMANAA